MSTAMVPAATGGWERASLALLTLFAISLPILAWTFEAGVALTASHILAAATIVLALAVAVVVRAPLTIDLAGIAFAGFVLTATITVVRVNMAPDVVILGESLHLKSIKQLIGLWFAFGLYAALRYLLETFRLGAVLIRVHFWTTAATAALTLLQFGVALVAIDSPWANFPVSNSTLGETRGLGTGVLLYGFPRVSLTLVEPSRLGIYLMTGWAYWLYALDRNASAAGRWFTVSGVLLGAAALVTGSRSAYLVFMVIVAGAVMFRPHRLYRLGLVSASLVVAAALAGPWNTAGVTATLLPEAPAVSYRPNASRPQVPETEKRFLDRVQDRLVTAGRRSGVSARHRIGSVVVALSVVRDYPAFGIGYGTSEFAMAMRYPDKMGPILGDKPFRPTMLGAYLTILAETGIVGSIWFCGLIAGTALSLVRAIRAEALGVRIAAWGAGASLAAYAIAMTGQAIEVYQFLLVWLLVAVTLALGTHARQVTPARDVLEQAP